MSKNVPGSFDSHEDRIKVCFADTKRGQKFYTKTKCSSLSIK